MITTSLPHFIICILNIMDSSWLLLEKQNTFQQHEYTVCDRAKNKIINMQAVTYVQLKEKRCVDLIIIYVSRKSYVKFIIAFLQFLFTLKSVNTIIEMVKINEKMIQFEKHLLQKFQVEMFTVTTILLIWLQDVYISLWKYNFQIRLLLHIYTQECTELHRKTSDLASMY